MASKDADKNYERILITGASSGIGWSLAKGLSPHCKTMALVARRLDLLMELKRELLAHNPALNVLTLACDLRKTEDREILIQTISSEMGGVDLLINNAGHGDYRFFEFSQWEKTHSLIELNVTALVHLCQKFLPGMLQQKRGGIFNVSSILGHVATPGLATYVGSKHFVTGFTKSLRAELYGTGVKVCQLCPGPVDTDFEGTGGVRDSSILRRYFLISPEACAKTALDGFFKNKAVIVPGGISKFLYFLLTTVPSPLQRWLFSMSALFQRKFRRPRVNGK